VNDTRVRVERARAPLCGRLRVPGSKSLSTRAIILAAISPAPVLLRDLLVAEDTERLLAAVNTMGARVSRVLGADWRIDGAPLRADARPAAINLGDGGAPTRFAMALASLRSGVTVVDGSERMRERPIEDGVRLLRALGVRIDALEGENALPLRVHGAFGTPRPSATARFDGPELDVARTASSQFVTALLLIAPALPAGLRLRFTEAPTSASYLSLTLEALSAFGARVVIDRGGGTEARGMTGSARAGARTSASGSASTSEQSLSAGASITVDPGLRAPASYEVPVDASSAVVWAAAAAIVPGSRLELEGVRRDAQPDVQAIEAIGRMGAEIEWRDDALVVTHAPLRGVDLDASAWPDGALAVAAAATAARGATRLRGLGTLRVKESDRLAAVALEFGRLGHIVRIEGDDLVIDPGAADSGAAATRVRADAASAARPSTALAEVVVDTHRDHRMAMSLALLGLRRGGVIVDDPGCVAKSYPGFWRQLALLAPHATAAAV